MTNDPAREYEQRPGMVERLPDAVAALILCKTGFARIERHQIKVKIDLEEYVFASSRSVTIAEKNGTGERVLWAINRHSPDILHILTEDGGYVESVPLKGKGEWFNPDNSEALAEAARMRKRDMARLALLHEPDTANALAREQHNAAEVRRIVNTFSPEPRFAEVRRAGKPGRALRF